MSKSIFVSHVYEEKKYKDRIAAWAEQGRLGNVVITGETHDVRQGGGSAVRGHLSPKLRGAAALVVLASDVTHDRPWLNYEVAFAQAHGIRVVVARVPGTRGAAPKEVRGLSEVAFEPGALHRALG